MGFRNLIAILGVGLTLTACADLFTIHRVTEIPNRVNFKMDPDRYYKEQGKAIHLDAQQRLVLATARGYCAEPSPDAMASYAAALGFDLDIFGENPAALTQALKSDAASIGLRTQSITLMRDILYRMCEASNNGRLNDTEVAAFLRRSQDLIAVVLAIEQLTGAVAANQVILTPSAKAGTSANLVLHHQSLDQMEKDVKEKEKEVADAQSKLDTAKSAKDKAEIAKVTSEAEVGQTCTQKTSNKEPCVKARAEMKEAKKTLSEAENNVKTTEKDLKAAQKYLEKTEEVRDRIKALRDAALTSATAETAGTGQFSPVIQRKQLSDKTTESIASAVESMVKHVLNKPYMSDVCLSHLISSKKDIEEKEKQVNEIVETLKQQQTDEITSALEGIQTMRLQTPNNGIEKGNQQIEDLEIQDLTIQAKEAIQAIRRINEINAICKDILKKHSEGNENSKS